MKKIISILLLSLIAFSCYFENRMPIEPKKDLPDIVMHRGLHLFGKLAPENSLDAISLTSRVGGAKFIEIDLNVTKDHEIILFHDSEINKALNNASDYSSVEGEYIYCNTLTLAELRQNYVLKAEDPAMRRPVPTLEEALIICKTEGLYPYIEIKEGFFTKQDVRKTYDTAIRIMGKGNFAITSFSAWIIEFLRSLDRELSLYRDMIEDVEYLKKYRINYYPHYEPSWYGYIPDYEENIKSMHREGLLASAWTVPKEAYDTILVKGYDGILSDDVAPMFNKAFAIYNDRTDGMFSSYITSGTIVDNVLNLKAGQELELKETVADSLYLGGLYFNIEAKGKFAIEANGFYVERENSWMIMLPISFSIFSIKNVLISR